MALKPMRANFVTLALNVNGVSKQKMAALENSMKRESRLRKSRQSAAVIGGERREALRISGNLAARSQACASKRRLDEIRNDEHVMISEPASVVLEEIGRHLWLTTLEARQC